jgi:hypothetical protein
MKKAIFTILLILILPGLIITAQKMADAVLTNYNQNAVMRQLSENVYAEILPRVELLAGVLSQTSWMDRMGPEGNGNTYFVELRKFFEKYKDHPALETAEELTEEGFSYDAPLNFILNRGPLPTLEGSKYSEYLIDRADGEKILEEFRLALKKLSDKSGFLKFFKNHDLMLNQVLDSTIKGFEAVRITNWLHEYFGYKGDEFHLVFAPSMFPGGGYGASGEVDGKKVVYQVIRTDKKNQGIPLFPTKNELAELTFHELGHSFVDPAIDEFNELLEEYDLEDLFDPVEDKMRQMAYPNLNRFLNETHVRAMTILAMEDYTGKNYDIDKSLEKERERGFYFIDYTFSKMKEYKNNRRSYKTFKEWMSELLMNYRDDKEALLELYK